VKFGKLSPTNGGAIRVYSDALKGTNIKVRLLLIGGEVFLEGEFRVTTANFIDIPNSRVHEWIRACGRNRVDLTGRTDERNTVYASQAAHSTLELYFAEQRGTSATRNGSSEWSSERPRKIATNERLVVLIAADFYDKKLDLQSRKGTLGRVGWDTLPEVYAAHQIRGRGHPDHVVRLFLTFVSAMDRARDSTRLWLDALALFEWELLT